MLAMVEAERQWSIVNRMEELVFTVEYYINVKLSI